MEVVHAGTYNGNALVIAAVNAVLDEVTKNDGEFYKRLTALGKRFMKGIEDAAKANGVKIRTEGPGPMFGIAFTEDEFHDFRSYAKIKNSAWGRFRRRMLENGVHIFPTDKGLFYLSGAHTDADIDFTLEVINKVFSEFDYNE